MSKYKITWDTWDKVATLYQEKFMDLDLYNDSYYIFCKLITRQNPHILELGCGPGNITRHLILNSPDANILGIDIAPNMVKLAKQNNPSAHFDIMDCREIGKIKTSFDGIMSGFCIPYLSKKDCSKFLQDSSHLLNKGAIFYLSAIEGHYADSGYATASTGNKTYVHYYEEDFLKKEMAKNDLKVLLLMRKAYIKNDGAEEIHLIFIAKKQR